MDQEPDPDAEKKPDVLPKPSIPPPSIAANLPKSAPPAAPVEPVVKVKIRAAGDSAGESPATDGAAPFNPRVVAVLIDLLVGLGVTLGCIWLLPGLLEWMGQFVGLAYFVTRDSLALLGGQSVGKKAMKLKVTTLEGVSLTGSWTVAVIRNGVLLIPFFALVELYILLTRENGPDRGRRLGDEWAKTKVILDAKPAEPEEEE